MTLELAELVVRDATAWRRWLDDHHAQPDGVWLVLAKKGTTRPTSLTYDAALEEALCYGWIDGQAGRRDEATYRQRFTPRRRRSPWSKRNTDRAERLLAEGRMHPAGIAEMQRAKADGRWEAAYGGSTEIEVPPDLVAALAATPKAQAMFEALNSQNRYAILYRLTTARRADTRARWVVFYSLDSHPIEQMRNPLTMLACDMNGEPLSHGHVAPLRLRNEAHRGFKQVKWIAGIEFVAHFSEVGGGYGGYNEDHEFFGYRQSI